MGTRRTNVCRATKELNDYLKQIAAAKRRLLKLDQEWQAILSRYYHGPENPRPEAVVARKSRHRQTERVVDLKISKNNFN